MAASPPTGNSDTVSVQTLHTLVSGLSFASPSSPTTSLTNPTDWTSASASTTHQSQFNAPNRSIFSSGPPTSSLSVNTAHASMSGSSSRPLSALTLPSANASRRARRYPHRSQHKRTSSVLDETSPGAEKDIDDITTPVERRLIREEGGASTPIALAHLFSSSRQPSYNDSEKQTYSRASSETKALPDHLYTRGFLEGRHSDITIHAFGTAYRLHRIILDRTPFFSTAFSEPWSESSAKDITINPDEIDPNITKAAFELALKRLYGYNSKDEEQEEALGLFATARWLEMSDLVESTVETISRQMAPENLADILQLVASNYYGIVGERLLASAKAMLCRVGAEMAVEHWSDIPSSIVQEVVGGDGFFIAGEWERWKVARKIMDLKLRNHAKEAGVTVDEFEKARPSSTRPSVPGRSNSGLSRGGEYASNAIYSHSEIAPIVSLLVDDIYYVHLSFEQLQYIKKQKNVMGHAVVPDKVLMDAFWMATELRQEIVNAQDLEEDLGLQHNAYKVSQAKPKEDSAESGDSGGEEKGGSSDSKWIRVDSYDTGHLSDSDEIAPSDQKVFVVPTSDSTSTSDGVESSATSIDQGGDHCFTYFPPFRFSAEFPNPRLLKEKKRVYSRTVWYAGSLWNLYIQKVRSSKNIQLGVYLHRAKDGENDEALTSSTSGVAQGSVDRKIERLEREMNGLNQRTRELSREYEREIRFFQQLERSRAREDDTGLSRGDIKGIVNSLVSDTTLNSASNNSTERDLLGSIPSETDDAVELLDQVSALPPYVDTRPTIKTYFKIFCPSKGGRRMSVYQSAPDKFNFSQSWGWKSSALLLDDGMSYEDDGATCNENLRFTVVIGVV